MKITTKFREGELSNVCLTPPYLLPHDFSDDPTSIGQEENVRGYNAC